MQEHFNKEVLDDPSVAYFSYGGDAAVSIGDKWIHWLKWFHAHLLQSDGPNDGLVSVASAKWGKYLGTIQVSALLSISYDGRFCSQDQVDGPCQYYQLVRAEPVEYR